MQRKRFTSFVLLIGILMAALAVTAGGVAAGNYHINHDQGDHAIRLYSVTDENGDPALEVYRIVGDEGQLVMTITNEDIEPYLDNPPEEHTLLKWVEGEGRYGPVGLYMLSYGTMQINIGADDEYRVQSLIFEGPWSTSLLDYYVWVVNQ